MWRVLLGMLIWAVLPRIFRLGVQWFWATEIERTAPREQFDEGVLTEWKAPVVGFVTNEESDSAYGV